MAVPHDAPPLFIVVAGDDDFAGASLALHSAWRAAGRLADLHVYAQGGHGFGMKRQGLPSDHWIVQFGHWLQP